MEGALFDYRSDGVIVTKVCPLCDKKYEMWLTPEQIKQYFTGSIVYIDDIREFRVLNQDVCCGG